MNIPIFDGHNDTIPKLSESRDFFLDNAKGHLDLPKAKKGNMRGGLFALFTPAETEEERKEGYGLTISGETWEITYPRSISHSWAKNFVNKNLTFIHQLAKEHPKEIKIISNFQELFSSMQQDLINVVLHFEGAEAIDEKLKNLENYYEQGLRSLGITWSRANCFGYGVPFKYPSSSDVGPGLTSYGKELVHACNNLGIMIDLAHLNKKGFFDVAKISKQPLIVSHSAVNNICPTARNLTDDQLDAIKDSGGVVGIIFDMNNTRPDGGITPSSLDVLLPHFNYIIERIGIDHIAFGSDFDGAKMPTNLQTAADFPNLLNALKQYVYSDIDLEKIAYKNWLRVIKAAWKS
jgi:membrane dipeptidase